ncbi:hypothetical protein [Parasitella parasitica]|uniref:Uncharacterized protein n=1 Tax=Parasitella parasitica TaxID=35722 RepID=A0A0B7NA51_9FUNG|nr:hypothetical protein [Parasitella parasitica]
MSNFRYYNGDEMYTDENGMEVVEYQMQVLEKGMPIRAAAKELNLPATTAQSWYKRGMKSLAKTKSGRPVGRPPKLSSEHKGYLVRIIDEKPGIFLDEMMEKLTSEFEGLDKSRSKLQEFATTKCSISLKRAHFQPEERNSEDKIKERFEWVTEILQTDVDYLSNCVFIDESGFNIATWRGHQWGRHQL